MIAFALSSLCGLRVAGINLETSSYHLLSERMGVIQQVHGVERKGNDI